MDDIIIDPFTAVYDLALHTYLNLFAITFLYYDHIITFALEIKVIWRYHKSPSAIFFFLNRYLGLLANVVVAIFLFVTPSESGLVASVFLGNCKAYGLVRQILLVVNQALVCLLLTLRIFALYARDLRVFTFMALLATCLLGITGWALTGQNSSVSAEAAGCHIANSNMTGIHIAVGWEAQFLYDTVLFGLTLSKTFNTRHIHGFATCGRINLVSIVLRDGAIYFALMALANLSNVFTFYLARPLLKGCLTTFASCISVTMMSRLMLNLHSSAATGIFSTTSAEPSSIAFTSRAPDTHTLAFEDTKDSKESREMEMECVARTVQSQQEDGVYEIGAQKPTDGEHV